MTEKTSEDLAQVLDDAELTDLAARARADEFHDFKTPHAMPQHVLVTELKKANRNDLAQRVIQGEFDASPEEAKAWQESPDGRETLRLAGISAEQLGGLGK